MTDMTKGVAGLAPKEKLKFCIKLVTDGRTWLLVY